ncbi:uncharacterized protein [Mytilus edulis]|uniref:uncharacterized protein n=1 Tax=Mytilus edulis TaxID=6550 RepID=UPI0039EEE76C
MPIGAIPFPFGKCKICKDKATGVHYGVATCEGCKGFFKRSIPKAHKYKCFFGGQCDISPKNRNRCKSCRFNMCLQFGMSIDAVKMGRIPKTEKEKALAEAADETTPDQINNFLQSEEPSSSFPQNVCSIEQRHSFAPQKVCAVSQQSLERNSEEGNHMHVQHMNTLENSEIETNSRVLNHDFHERSEIEQNFKERLQNCQEFQEKSQNERNFENWRNPRKSANGNCQNLPYMDFQKTEFSEMSWQTLQKGHIPALPNPSSQHNTTSGINSLSQPHSPDGINSLSQRDSTDGINSLSQRNSTDGINSLSQRHSTDGINSLSFNTGSETCDKNMHESNSQNVQTFSNNHDVLRPSTFSSLNSDVQMTTCGPNVPSTSKVHFSSIVIEELVRQVLEKPEVTQILHERSNSLSSQSSTSIGEGQLDALRLAEVASPNENNTNNAVTYNMFDAENLASRQIGNVQQINFDMNGTEVEKSEEVAKESKELINVTLERFKAPVDLLFHYQAFNRDCYKNHKSGEWKVPMTNTNREELKFIWNQLMEGVKYYNEQVMGFASKTPGFSKFTMADQEKLTMNAYMEIWMMINSEFLCENESYVLLNNTKVFYSKATMKMILGEELTTLMLDFGRKFSQYNLSDTEIGLLCAIRLTNPDVENLEEKDKVELLNSHFLDIFASMFNKRPHSSRMALSLFQYMSVLKTITQLQQEAIFNFSLDSPPEEVVTEIEVTPT